MPTCLQMRVSSEETRAGNMEASYLQVASAA